MSDLSSLTFINEITSHLLRLTKIGDVFHITISEMYVKTNK